MSDEPTFVKVTFPHREIELSKPLRIGPPEGYEWRDVGDGKKKLFPINTPSSR